MQRSSRRDHLLSSTSSTNRRSTIPVTPGPDPQTFLPADGQPCASPLRMVAPVGGSHTRIASVRVCHPTAGPWLDTALARSAEAAFRALGAPSDCRRGSPDLVTTEFQPQRMAAPTSSRPGAVGEPPRCTAAWSAALCSPRLGDLRSHRPARHGRRVRVRSSDRRRWARGASKSSRHVARPPTTPERAGPAAYAPR